MKKRAYRARKIKQVNIERLSQNTAERDLVVGIDVAKHVQFAAFSLGPKEIVETVRFRHPEQTPEFLDLLDRLPCSSLQVAVEPTGSYGDALRCQMIQRGHDVYRVSAKKVHDAREIYDGVPSSHDAKSAAIIAWLHIEEASELWPMDSEAKRELNSSIALMWIQDERYQQGLNRLEAYLARYWPEVTRILDVDTVTLLTLLATYGGPQKVARDRKQAAQLMRDTGGRFLSEEKISAVVRSAAETAGVVQIEAERELMSEVARMTLDSRRLSRNFKARVEALTEDVSEVQAMGQVVGKSSAAVLNCKVGSPLSFPNARAYEKSAGLNLRVRSSGKYEGRLKLTKRGSGQARQYLFLAALRLLQTDPLVRAWYDKKVARDGGVKLKAVVALMRKLIRALWHVGHGAAFDSRLLFDANRLTVAAS
jgi:transposase